MTEHWRRTVVSLTASLGDAARSMDTHGMQVATVLDASGRLAGILTDGDLRRALLNGGSLETPVSLVANLAPKKMQGPISRTEALSIMNRLDIAHLPIVDERGCLIGLEFLRDASIAPDRVCAVIMAGGFGKRLAPLTDEVPKPLLPVEGQPMIEYLIKSLVDNGITRIVVSVFYHAAKIKAFCGDGSRWGADISYIQETEPRGTGGALSLLESRPQDQLLVVNSDILTSLDFSALLHFHREQGNMATMCVREQEFQIRYGVVTFEGPYVTDIVEKPVQSYFINAGIYVLDPSALDLVPPSGHFDMPSLLKRITQAGYRTNAFPLREYWLDIGTLTDYKTAQSDAVGWGARGLSGKAIVAEQRNVPSAAD